MTEHDRIPPERLMEAVDAIFIAASEGGLFTDRPSRLMGRPQQPSVFCDFTVYEIREAESFLARCGLMHEHAVGPSLN